MRVAVYNGGGAPFEIEERPDPEPNPGEVVIKVGRCGICGTDLHMTSGHAMDFPAGSVLGHEYAGEVVAVGDQVDHLRTGDLITALPAAGCGRCDSCKRGNPVLCPETRSYLGGFAQFTRVAAESAVKLPRSLTLADGALVEPLAVGLHGASMADIRPGSRVLVLGGGPVGLTAIFWARQLGAGRIAAASRSQRRAELTGAMGADGFVAFDDDEGERIAAILGGAPDIVIEAVGMPGMLAKAIERVRSDGTIVSMGCGLAYDTLLPVVACFKQVRLLFSMAWTLGEFEHAARTLDRGHVEPRDMVSKTIGLDQLRATMAELRAGDPQTKVQLNPWV